MLGTAVAVRHSADALTSCSNDIVRLVFALGVGACGVACVGASSCASTLTASVCICILVLNGLRSSSSTDARLLLFSSASCADAVV